MPERILVLNPNSTRAVTDGISQALEPLRMAGGPAIECATLAEGPPGIETDQHVAEVAEPVGAWVRAHAPGAGAFVIACFSDPGLDLARERVRVPVLGMAQCGLLAALARGRRIGVVSILETAVRRHRAQFERLGIAGSVAGDRAVGLGVLDLADEGHAFERMRETGERLRDEDGADVLVMGCAGMATQRASLEAALGVPVVDPVHAAVAMAIGAIRTAA